MSVSFPPRPRVTARWLAALVASLLLGCTVVRNIGYSNYRVTRDEAARLDAGEKQAETLRKDPYRECLSWKEVATSADADAPPTPNGFKAYVGLRVSYACNPDEALLLEAQNAIRAAQEASGDLEAQLLAVASVDAFARAQGLAVNSPDNLTLRDLLAQVAPILPRLSLPETACQAQLPVTALLWTLGDTDVALARYLGPQRECLGAKETARVTRPLREQGRCEEVVALAAEVWPRMTEHEDQIRLLDLVRSCSDAYTMRRNFAFVPRDILFDYQALLDRRAVEQAQADWAREQHRLTERCEESCGSIYGGVCVNSCRGDTICVENCQALGRSCQDSCGF